METRSPPRSSLPIDEFCSKSGAVIVLGRVKNHDANPGTVYKHTFIVHDTKPDAHQHVDTFKDLNKGGLQQTRFHKGFQRKKETDISNVVRDQRLEHAKHVGQRAEQHQLGRTEFLKTIDNYNGYNIITGGARQGPGGLAKVRAEGIRPVGDGLGPEAPKRANILLRDSPNRFFTPQYSGPNHDHRQHVLVNDGCFDKRHSSIIIHGRKDLPSAGIEDQFSKSEYTKNSHITSHGLAEKREPAKYTPRKQMGHPSGDPSTVANWGKGIDLSNRAAAGGAARTGSYALDTSSYY